MIEMHLGKKKLIFEEKKFKKLEKMKLFLLRLKNCCLNIYSLSIRIIIYG